MHAVRAAEWLQGGPGRGQQGWLVQGVRAGGLKRLSDGAWRRPGFAMTTKIELQPRRIGHGLDRGKRLALERGLECTQALIDRDQVDDGAPGSDQILKRASDLPERPDDLVHGAKRDVAGHDGGSQQDVGKNRVSLQVNDAADVEVQEVQVKPEIVPANVDEQRVEGRWIGPGRVVFAEHQFLAVGSFDPLVEELDAGQLDAD